MRHYAEMMSDSDADLLQEAGMDIAYLTAQGESPTDAIAKVAALARFPKEKTDLLTYAYSNGMSAEKRASGGGVLERLGEFDLPDPQEIRRRVYGEKDTDVVHGSSDESHPSKAASVKTAGMAPSFLPLGMETFETDTSGMDPQQIRSLLGLQEKTASDKEDSPPGGSNGFSISRTSISFGLGSSGGEDHGEDCPCSACGKGSAPKALKAFLERTLPEVPADLETALLSLLRGKKEAMIQANAEADDAFTEVGRHLDRFGDLINFRHLEPRFKKAGLVSVHAYFPDIGDLLGTYLNTVNRQLIKDASYDSTDITVRHPWVKEAGSLKDELERVVDLTLTARHKAAEYQAVCLLYTHRDQLRKKANWGSFAAGMYIPQLGNMTKTLLANEDESKKKKEIKNDLLSSLNDPGHELDLRDIETLNTLNKLRIRDPILKSVSDPELYDAFTRMVRMAPSAMRNPFVAESLLQHVTMQQRLAPTEHLSAMQLDEKDPRKIKFDLMSRKNSDD